MSLPSIVEDTELLKLYPDQALVREMQNPTGSLGGKFIPPIFITTELKNRQRIRNEQKRREAADQPTVAEEVVMAAGVPQQGIMQMARNMAPKTNMGQNTGVASMMPKQPTMGMSDGGVVKMQEGGKVEEPKNRFEMLMAYLRSLGADDEEIEQATGKSIAEMINFGGDYDTVKKSDGGVVKMQPGGMMSNIMSLMAPPSYNLSQLGSLDEPKQTALEEFAEQNPNPQVQKRMEVLNKARAGDTIGQIVRDTALDTADIINIIAGGASLLVTDTAALAGDVAGIVAQAAGLPNTAEGIFGVSQDLREYGRDQFTRPEDELFTLFGDTYYTPRLFDYNLGEKRQKEIEENLRKQQGLTTPEERAEIAAQSDAAINRASPETLRDTGEAVPFTGRTDLLSVTPENVMVDPPELGVVADPTLLGNVSTTLDDAVKTESGLGLQRTLIEDADTAPDLSAIPEDMAQDEILKVLQDPSITGIPDFLDKVQNEENMSTDFRKDLRDRMLGLDISRRSMEEYFPSGDDPRSKAISDLNKRAFEFLKTDTFTPPSEIYGDVTEDKLQETPPALSNLFAQTLQNQRAGIPGGSVPVLNDPTNEMQNMIAARETEAAEEAARRELNEFLSRTNTEGQPGGTVPDTTSLEARVNRAKKYITNLGDDIKNMTKEDVINGFLSIGGQLSDLKNAALGKIDDLTDTAAEKVNELQEYFKSTEETAASESAPPVLLETDTAGAIDPQLRPKIRPKDLGKREPAGSASNVPVEARIAELMAKRQKSAEQDKWLALAKTGVIMSSGDPKDLRRAGEVGIKALQTSRAQKDKYDAAMLGLQARIDAYKARIAKPTTLPAAALTVLQNEMESAEEAVQNTANPTDAQMQKALKARQDYENALAVFFAQQGLSSTQTAQTGRESFNFSDTT